MTLVQAQIPEGEYRLLRQLSSESGQPMKEIVRKAIHAYLEKDEINPQDPLYSAFPLGQSGPKGHSRGRYHDRLLYRTKKT